ncbi:hypothetical protein L7F22_030623 [Adiantum nelumboides]|nr:hypothetical protein [Adiantum nelumboides]
MCRVDFEVDAVFCLAVNFTNQMYGLLSMSTSFLIVPFTVWSSIRLVFQIGEQNIAWGLKFSAKGVINVEERPIEVLSSSICRRIDFVMIEGDFQIFKGTWQMEQVSDQTESPVSEAVASSSQGTVLTYVVDVQPKLWLPVRLVEGILSKEIQNNLLCIRNQVLKSCSLLTPC